MLMKTVMHSIEASQDDVSFQKGPAFETSKCAPVTFPCTARGCQGSQFDSGILSGGNGVGLQLTSIETAVITKHSQAQCIELKQGLNARPSHSGCFAYGCLSNLDLLMRSCFGYPSMPSTCSAL